VDTSCGCHLFSCLEGVKKLLGPGDHAGGAVVDWKMYVIGGRDGGAEGVRGDVFELDLGRMDGWKTRGK
jgi:hypothetical protein